MDKKCFVIMPISDSDDYTSGHWGRVYEYIIKPACLQAGFKPIRADDILTTNYIAIDIIKYIISSEMAICDLSGRNPNVLYELGIRQAFNLPVTLIKDSKTQRIFDIQGFRDLEYDENLRIDNVQEVISDLTEIIKNTYQNTNEINSLVGLLSIEPAKISEKNEISLDTEVLLNSISNLEKRFSELIDTTKVKPNETVYYPTNSRKLLSKLDWENLKVGDRLYHEKFGNGIITKLTFLNGKSDFNHLVVEVNFDDNGEKTIMVRYAKFYSV